MQPLELESPGLEILEELEDNARENLRKPVIGGVPEDPELSVDLYLLGLNQRVTAENVNRMAPHVQDPYLLISFKGIDHEDYREMCHGFQRESIEDIKGLRNRFDESLGDYLVFLEEYYAMVSEGELDAELFHVPAEVSGMEQNIRAAESIDAAMRNDPDYNIKDVRLVGGVERADVEEALEDIRPAIIFNIGYSGDQGALEAYNKYLEEATPKPGDAEAVPGTVYIGKESYPNVYFNGPPYASLDDGELEKRLWEEIEDK